MPLKIRNSKPPRQQQCQVNSTWLSMPSPTQKEMDSDEFNAIWNIIKTWDIKVPEYSSGYSGGNGSHVKLILDALYPVLRNKKIEEILK